ncbi:MAG: Gfo/Idh/MocA family protein [Bryobacteraceae bacterium]
MESIRVGVATDESAPHWEIYLQAVAAADGVEKVSIAGAAGPAAAQASSILGPKMEGSYASVGEMLERLRPHAALVTMEGRNAPEAIRAALSAGCHVMAEKPACTRAEDFEPLVRLAERSDRHLMLALATRLHPWIQQARDLVRQGRLGTLYGASFRFLADQTRLTTPEYQGSWFASKTRAGGGQLLWLGIHYIDLAQYISGQTIRKVAGLAGNVGGQPMDVEDSAAVALEFDGGLMGTLQCGYYLDKGYSCQLMFWGSEGRLSMDMLEGHSLEWYSKAEGVKQFPLESGVIPSLYPRFVQAGVDVARGVAAPFITGAEALEVLKAVFAVYRSSETGRTQTLSS